ncbi:hypothetical protein Xaut_0523 [Xanthobacter versatilis]|uniref:Uncharacterized protein n=1 Tax=Xanthobacter autotrophicus (strain ATCC BAA-1158 / Py2) TaxID=78245 RepID=A7ICN7_XANP2|nr:hypothetical protein Xaut_0523 [Xanthobacter autotrophicus Py2]
MIFFGFSLKLLVDRNEGSFFYLEGAIDRIDKEWQFPAPARILVGGAFHLPGVEFNSDLREDLPGLFEPDIARWQLHAAAPFARARPKYSTRRRLICKPPFWSP